MGETNDRGYKQVSGSSSDVELPVPLYEQSPDVPADFEELASAVSDEIGAINTQLEDGVGETYTLSVEGEAIALTDSKDDSTTVGVKAGENVTIDYEEDEITINAASGDSDGLPPGGTTNQVLTKLDDDVDGDADWRDPQGGDVECATNYDELKDCAPTGGGSGGGCYKNYGDQKNCSPSDGGGGGGCYGSWEDLVSCSPGDDSGGSSQDHVVLIGDVARPTKYVGKGRPDVDGVPGTPVEGDTYTCLEPGTDTNLGAKEWRYNSQLNRWEVTAGVYRWTVPLAHLGENWEGGGGGDGSMNTVTVSPNQVTVTAWAMTTTSGTDEGAFNLFLFNPSNGNSVYNYNSYDMGLGVAGTTQFSAGVRQYRLAVGTPTASSSVPSGTMMGTWTYTKTSPGTWPTQKELTVPPAEFRAHIEQAIEDNPELADQLREELKLLEGDFSG